MIGDEERPEADRTADGCTTGGSTGGGPRNAGVRPFGRRQLLGTGAAAAGFVSLGAAACAYRIRATGAAPGGQPATDVTPPAAVTQTSPDVQLILQKLDALASATSPPLPFGELVARAGALFIGTPYVAGTLDGPGPEQVVVNLRQLDCVTLVENALAMARLVSRRMEGAGVPPTDVLAAYRNELRTLRYRSGTVGTFASRLHYFSEWIADNAARGTVDDLTAQLGGRPLAGRLSFMSAHPGAYPQLADAGLLDAIRQAEAAAAERPRYAIPAERVRQIVAKLQPGDVLAVATSIPGLDVSHTGLACWVDGSPHLLHAPKVGGSVVIAPAPLPQWLSTVPHQAGLMVARPREPAAG